MEEVREMSSCRPGENNFELSMGAHDKDCRWPQGADSGLWLTATKKTGTSVLQPQGAETCQASVSLEEDPGPQMK